MFTMRRCPKCGNEYEDAVSFCPRDGEVLEEARESIVGRVLDGKYEVESFIARGGMGAVYLARHILLGDRVVIKTLRSEMRSNSEWLRRFQREGRAARSFRHPNSVTVYDLSTTSDGLVYLVMEYVEGRTLDKELKERGRFAPAEALEILRPVADVLDAAHAKGVVHRDLKPENIILNRSDGGAQVVKVLDLGIAKLKGMPDGHSVDAGPLTVAGQVLGTPYYMSPEQWGETPRDGNAEVDGRADVYALGVICFELVAGRKPLGGRTLSELRHEHVSTPLPLLHEVAPDVPESFGLAVARAMSKDRADRHASAGAFVAELSAAVAGEGRAERKRHTAAAPASYATVFDDALARPASERDTSIIPERRDTRARSDDAHTDARLMPTVTFDEPPPAPETEAPTAVAAHGTPQPGRAHGASVMRSAGAVQSASAAAGASASQGASAAGSARRRGPLIAAALLGIVILACVGGLLAWNRMRAEGPPAAEGVAPPPAAAEAPRVEALRYWLEAFGTSGKQTPRRLAETSAELSSGEYFKFHFVPRERGYLYIIGPGKDGNAHTLFLGARGAMKLKTNQVAAGADFAFPFGNEQGDRLGLDKNPGAEDYTVIFSPTPLVAPSALTREVPYTLTLAELKELEDFRAQHKDDALRLNVNVLRSADARAVSVSVPETRDGARPIIFDVRIEHK